MENSCRIPFQSWSDQSYYCVWYIQIGDFWPLTCKLILALTLSKPVFGHLNVISAKLMTLVNIIILSCD